MRIGPRKPSVKKSLSARTTGKVNRKLNKAVNPLHGKKGMGMVNDPKKAVYNKVYNKTTIGYQDVYKKANKQSSAPDAPGSQTSNSNSNSNGGYGCIVFAILMLITGIIVVSFSLWGIAIILIAIVLLVFSILWKSIDVPETNSDYVLDTQPQAQPPTDSWVRELKDFQGKTPANVSFDSWVGDNSNEISAPKAASSLLTNEEKAKLRKKEHESTLYWEFQERHYKELDEFNHIFHQYWIKSDWKNVLASLNRLKEFCDKSEAGRIYYKRNHMENERHKMPTEEKVYSLIEKEEEYMMTKFDIFHMIQSEPILQKDLFKMYEDNRNLATKIVKELVEEGAIKKEKKGSTFLLTVD